MANPKIGPLPIPSYGGPPANGKPLEPAAPPIEAEKHLLAKHSHCVQQGPACF